VQVDDRLPGVIVWARLWFAKTGSKGMSACDTAATATFRPLGAGLRYGELVRRAAAGTIRGRPIFAAKGRAHQQAARKEPTYLDFLDEVLGDELDAKQKKRVAMAVPIAHFPT